jgi:hypothetical protein
MSTLTAGTRVRIAEPSTSPDRHRIAPFRPPPRAARTRQPAEIADTEMAIVSFGEDDDGELYVGLRADDAVGAETIRSPLK